MALDRRRDNAPSEGPDAAGVAGHEAGASCCCCCWCVCCRDHEMRENWREIDVHGLRRMIPRKVTNRRSQAIRRTVWLILMLASLVAFLYASTECVFIYLSQPQFSNLLHPHHAAGSSPAADRLRYQTLPAVTLCNLNPLRLSELARRKWPTEARDAPSSGHVDTSAWSNVNASSFDVFYFAGHRLEKLVIRCSAGNHMPCSKTNFTEVLTEKGICYTIVPNASTLYLVLNAEAYEYTGLGQEGVGIRVLFHDAEELPLLTSAYSGLMLAPGLHATITVHQTDVTIISTPDSPCSNDDDVRSEMNCVSSCFDQIIERMCSCRPLWSHSKESRQKICSIKQHVSCAMVKLSELSKGSPSASCVASCGRSCNWHEILWHHAFSHLLPGLTSADRGRRYHADVIPEGRLAEIAGDRCVAANAAARTSRDISRRDNEQITELSNALGEVGDRMRMLQDNFQKVGGDLNASLNAIQLRLGFHVFIGLGGLRRSFVGGFADRFDLVRERSLTPLVDGHYETVSQLERTVKQLTFTSTTETVARKVLYFMTDNQLSGKLETAIQALDNLTRVYQSFLNSEPGSAGQAITPDGRYDIHLLPFGLLSKCQVALKTYYVGISENIAKLIETILSLKSVLKDVYQSNTVNETLFAESRQNFVHHTLQIRHFASLFQRDIVQRSLDQLDARINELTDLNRTLSAESLAFTESAASLANVATTSYSEAYNNVLAFSRLAQQFLHDTDIHKSSLTNQNTDAFIQSSALLSLVDALNTVLSQKARLRRLWDALADTTMAVWRRFLNEELLGNFYSSLYNDVTDMMNNPQRAEQFRSIFFHASMLGLVGTGPRRAGDYAPIDFYTLLNADVPITIYDTKMSQLAEEFRDYRDQTDGEQVVGSTRIDRLVRAFNELKKNLAELQTQCQVNEDLIRDNVIVADIVLSNENARHSTSPPAYTLTTLLANIGGLLALCLGASLVTCVEVVDVAIQALCRSLGSRKSRKFADTSNHVLFRPVDILDDGVATAGLRQPHVVKVPLPASIPKVKIDATYRGKHVQHQAETDI